MAVASVLERWRIYRVKAKADSVDARHFAVGYAPNEDDGYVSSAVKLYNPATRILTTVTGDRIELLGEPGTSRDADVQWQKFCASRRILGFDDISTRYLPKPKKKGAAK